MIRHKDLDPAEILREMTGGEHLPKRLAGPPQSDAERLEDAAAIQEIIANPDNVRTICIGCGTDTPLLESAVCICGGFVCVNCQEIEDDGLCDHLPLRLDPND